MTEIPEHLRKRAEAARAKASESSPPPADSAPEADPVASATEAAPAASAEASLIPAHLLERSKSAKARAQGGGGEPAAVAASSGGGGGGVAVAERVGTVTAAPAAGGIPVGAGPGGHTQRLLTVV